MGAHAPSGGGTEFVLKATKHVTSAELLAMFGAPVVVVAAPGPGKIILPITGIAYYTFVTTPYGFPNYDPPGVLNPAGNPPTIALEVIPAHMGTGVGGNNDVGLDRSADALLSLFMSYSTEVMNVSDAEDQPLALNIAAGRGPITDGDGTLDITVYYVVAAIP